MSLEFTALAVGPLQSNCFILADSDSKKCAIIDPGGNLDAILDILNEQALDVEWALLTHGHFDHTFHAGDLAERFECKIALHKADIGVLTASFDVGQLYYDMSIYTPCDEARMHFISHGDRIELGESVIEVIHTPGHTPGGVCYATTQGVFCGDTVFAGSIGRTDFPGGSAELMAETLATKILTMADDTVLHCGHGPDTTIGIERRQNPYLR